MLSKVWMIPAFFGDLPATGGDMAYFIRVALVNRLQHLQNLHIVARERISVSSLSGLCDTDSE